MCLTLSLGACSDPLSPEQDASAERAQSENNASSSLERDASSATTEEEEVEGGSADGLEGDDLSNDDASPPERYEGVTIGKALSCIEDEGVILDTPDTFSNYKSWGFTRYAELIAPNDKPIRIFAADKISDEMIHRARNVLRFFLSDHLGSTYGGDKTLVANSMADNGATLMLPNGAHEEGNEPPLDAQPLYESEMTVEGSTWYLENDWDHRDATFEEIFHLVHDTGIGTYLPGALPEYQAELLSEAQAAIADGRWGISVDPSITEWLEELEEENSLAQEYIASVIDSYYGYWGAFNEAPGGMWGIYIAKDRDEIQAKDPQGLTLVESFLPEMAHYEARLAKSFKGTFKMSFDADTAYTHKSRYLVAVSLFGSEDSSIEGNGADNHLRGNLGDNTLDGAEGNDRVIYCQERAAYTLTQEGDDLIIEGPEGRDTLKSIEELHFADTLYSTEVLTQ